MATLSLLSTLQQSPYFDDYAEAKKFLRLLFQPGVSLQVRELTQIQTFLQNQISRFGDSLYKDGSLVTGGEISFDNNVYYIRLADSTTNQSSFLNQKIKLVGDTDNNTLAECIAVADSEGTDPPTLVVRYMANDKITGTGVNIQIATDSDTTCATAGSGTISGLSSVATINDGVYYVNGFFVLVDAQALILEKYNNTPSYKVGLTISESIVTSDDDLTLLDNASGSYNVNAPGADRYKISLILSKNSLATISHTNFVELLRVRSGQVEKIVNYPLYGELENIMSRRTFDESGNYTVRPFLSNVNDHKGTVYTTTASSTTTINGSSASKFQIDFKVGDSIYLTNGSVNSTSTTITGITSNTVMTVADAIGSGETQRLVNNDKVSVGLESGKAYIRGYEYESMGTNFVDMRKGRDTATSLNAVVNPNFGNYFRITNLANSFNISTQSKIDLHCVPAANVVATTQATYELTKIGTARPRQIDYFTGTPGTDGVYDLYVYDTDITSITSSASSGTTAGDLTVDLDSTTSSDVPSAYVGAKITMTSGDAIGQTRTITVHSGNTVTVDKAFLTNIVSSDTCRIDFTTKQLDSIIASNSTFKVVSSGDISIYGRVDNLDNTSGTKFFETDKSSLVYELPQNVVKTLKPTNSSNYVYSVKHLFKNQSFSAGGYTKSITSGTFAGTPGQSLGTTGFLNNIIVTVTEPLSSGRSPGEIINIIPGTGDQAADLNGAGTGLTLDTGNNSDTFQADVYVTINLSTVASAAFNTKTLVSGVTSSFAHASNEDILRGNGQYKATSASDFANTTISLKTSDVNKLVAVVKSPTSDISGITSGVLSSAIASTSDSNNITDNYNLNTGQKDNIYDHGSISLKPGKSAATTPILVIFDFFTHGSTDGPFTVDSYSTINYSSIPEFVSPKTGKKVNLRNCVDFRPRRVDGDTSSDYSFDSISIEGASYTYPRIPDSDVVFTTDVEYYLPRKDKIVVSKDRNFKIIEGISSVNPIAPADEEDSMTLYIADIPEYTFNLNDIDLQYIENKRFTMRDIGSLEKRIEQLEYYTSLTFLEKDAKDQPIFTDAGVERFKNGILVDQFTGHSVGDVVDDDYKISIDYDKSILRPSYTSENFKFEFNPQGGSNVVKTGDLVSVAYTSTDFVVQPVTTGTEIVNPFGSTPFSGTLTLSPPSDTWFSQSKYVDVLMNLEGQNDNWSASRYNFGFGTQWDSWSKNWTGEEINTDDLTKTRKKKSITTQVDRSAKTIEESISREGILSKNQPETIKKTVNNKIVNDTIIPYSREQTVIFKAEGLKPKALHYVYIDDVNVTSQSESAVKLTTSTQTPFEANEGELVRIHKTGATDVFGTLVATDVNGNTTFLIANTSNNWLDSGIAGSGTEIQATYIDSSGSTTKEATLTADVANTGFVPDASGVLCGSIKINNGQFRAGERVIRITDQPDNIVSETTSVSEKVFHIKGLESVSDGDVISTRSALVRRDDITSNILTKDSVTRKNPSSNFTNPMAQTFYVDEARYPNGTFISSITLYFNNKDTELPITLQIRPMVNGVPSSSVVLPFSEKSLLPGQVSLENSPDTSSTSSGTKFTFSSPVYLPPGEHCFTVQTNSSNYKVHNSIEGNIVTNTTVLNTKAGKSTEVGKLFIAQNASLWNPIYNRTLMFKIEKCAFQTTSAAANQMALNVVPKSLSGSTSHTYFDLMKLNSSDLKFSSSVLDYEYQTTTADAGTRGTSYTSILSGKNENFSERKWIRTDHVDGNSKPDFLLRVGMSTTDPNVSPIIDLSRLNLITVKNNIQNGGFTNDDVSIISPGTGYSAGTLAINGSTGSSGQITLAVDGSGAITGATVSSAGSGYFDDASVTLSGGTGGEIKISSETNQNGGNNIARYITRRVSLASGFDAEDLKVYLRAYKPSTSNIIVYYKVLSAGDSESFDDKYWIKMSQVTDSNLFSSNDNDFQTFEFKTVNDTAEYTVGSNTYNNFRTFAIKMVLASSSFVDIPKVKDLRVIALDT